MKRSKLPGWERRFAAYMDQELVSPFVWGKTDCANLAAGAIEAQTGWRPAPRLLRSYSDEAGAIRVIERHGGLDKLVSRFLGPALVYRLQARRGDIATFQEDGELRLGVVVGELIATKGERGFAHRPLAMVRDVWAVGR